MASSNLIKQLQERGLVAQVTDEEALTLLSRRTTMTGSAI